MMLIIGVKIEPAKAGEKPVPQVFFCGYDAAEFRTLHGKLVEANTNGTKFFRLQSPTLVPLQNVATKTEDHPDHLAAQKQREAAEKKAAAKKPVQTTLNSDVSPQEEMLRKKSKAELNEILDAANATRTNKITPKGGKATHLIDAILLASVPEPKTETTDQSPTE